MVQGGGDEKGRKYQGEQHKKTTYQSERGKYDFCEKYIHPCYKECKQMMNTSIFIEVYRHI